MENTAVIESVSQEAIAPRWIRVHEVCRLYGLSRTKCWELGKAGKIRSVSLREKGTRQGTRLFCVKSLEAYIESFLPADEEGDNA